jgi:hypothetical protein
MIEIFFYSKEILSSYEIINHVRIILLNLSSIIEKLINRVYFISILIFNNSIFKQ